MRNINRNNMNTTNDVLYSKKQVMAILWKTGENGIDEITAYYNAKGHKVYDLPCDLFKAGIHIGWATVIPISTDTGEPDFLYVPQEMRDNELILRVDMAEVLRRPMVDELLISAAGLLGEFVSQTFGPGKGYSAIN